MDYELKITRKRIKNIIIKVRKVGIVEVSVPYFVNYSQVNEIIKLKNTWIVQRMQELSKAQKPKQISFLGKNYDLEFELGMRADVLIKDNKIIVNCLNESEAKDILDNFYKSKSKEIFQEILFRFCAITNKSIKSFKVRKMTTRWGSCNTKLAYINLNTELIKKDYKAIEAVIMHELTHLYYANHSKAFYDKLLEFMPDYYERIKLLKSNKEL